MTTTITTQPNQSLLDVILEKYGTLEAGMTMALANNVPISYIPLPGTQLIVPDSLQTDDGNVQYLRRLGIVPGTVAMPLLSCSMVMRPALTAIPTVTGNPHVIGYYEMELRETDEFFHMHPLAESYTGLNRMQYVTEERYLTGSAPENALPLTTVPMPEKRIRYRLPWTVGLGYMIVFPDLTEPETTVTFSDTEGNKAFFSPVIVLDNTTQEVLDVLCGRLEVVLVQANVDAVVVKVTRTHPAIHMADFATYVMEWTQGAIGGTPDPTDPHNADVTLLTLPPGTHMLGLHTTYTYIHTTPITAFPASGCSVAIQVQ
jgi:hypothetical protein